MSDIKWTCAGKIFIGLTEKGKCFVFEERILMNTLVFIVLEEDWEKS